METFTYVVNEWLPNMDIRIYNWDCITTFNILILIFYFLYIIYSEILKCVFVVWRIFRNILASVMVLHRCY
jgi:hypothetical protein